MGEKTSIKCVIPNGQTSIQAVIVAIAAACVSGLLSFTVVGADAQKTVITDVAPLESKQQGIAAIANAWGISPQEYQRYLSVMRGPRGTWSRDADPILALGVTAESVVEMRKYAEKYVRQEYQRTEKELAFQREVTAAWKRLFPATPRIGAMPASIKASTPLQQKVNTTLVPPRIAIIVQQACDHCRHVIQQYTQLISQRSALEAVDFYVTDSKGRDRVLQAWVNQHAIPRTLLEQGKVTVNHANAHSAITRFPTVYERRSDGKWSEKALR